MCLSLQTLVIASLLQSRLLKIGFKAFYNLASVFQLQFLSPCISTTPDFSSFLKGAMSLPPSMPLLVLLSALGMLVSSSLPPFFPFLT